MKQLINNSTIALSLLIFSACSSQPISTPSQNSALNSISKSSASKKQPAYLQKKINEMIDYNWDKNKPEDKKIVEKYEVDEDREFTLQEYFDKASAHSKKGKSSESNVEKLNKIPVIGK